MAWYENPQAWTAIVALLALVVGIFNLFTVNRLHRENARQKFQTDLQTIVTQINDAFLKYEVDTPYQVKMGLKDKKDARGKIVLLILQLNLLLQEFLWNLFDVMFIFSFGRFQHEIIQFTQTKLDPRHVLGIHFNLEIRMNPNLKW